MPSPGFEPGSPRPQSKSDDLDRSAMGPTYFFEKVSFWTLSKSSSIFSEQSEKIYLWSLWLVPTHLNVTGFSGFPYEIKVHKINWTMYKR